MKIKSRFKLSAVLSVLMLFTTGCNPSAPKKVETIVIGAATVAHSSPVWIAESKGYFTEEGLKEEIKEFDSGREALQTMLNEGGIDIATTAQMPVVSNSFKRSDFAIVGSMVYSDRDHKVLARQDRGIKAPPHLKGRTIGITANSSGHYFLGQFLVHYGLNLSDVRAVDLEAARLPQALIEGQVDAIATWEPNVYKAKKALGDKILVLPSEGVYRMDYYFVARKNFIKNHFQALTRFLKAIEKSDEFIGKNKKEAMDIVEQRVKMDREIINATWDDFRFRLFLDQSILTALEDEARWAIRNRLTDASNVPNYLDYLYTDALKAVRPAAVRIAGR